MIWTLVVYLFAGLGFLWILLAEGPMLYWEKAFTVFLWPVAIVMGVVRELKAKADLWRFTRELKKDIES